MLTKLKNLFIILITGLVLWNCTPTGDQEPEKGTIVISVGRSISDTRTIVPDTGLDIATYEITGTGPNSTQFQSGAVADSIYIANSLQAGTWTVSVIAKNTEGIVIGCAAAETAVTSGITTQLDITVKPLTGNGILSLSLSWTDLNLANPSVAAFLKPGNGSQESIAFTLDGDSAIYQNDQLDAGYYELSLRLLNGSNCVWGRREAVLVLEDQLTRAVFALDSSTINLGGNLEINIDQEMNNPLDITLSGNRPELQAGESMTVTASASIAPDSWQWYLNGEEIAAADSDIFVLDETLPPGHYWLDVMAVKGNIVSSQGCLFSVTGVSTAAAWDISTEPRIISHTATSFELGWTALSGAAVYELYRVTAWNPVVMDLQTSTGNTALTIDTNANSTFCIVGKTAEGTELDRRYISGARMLGMTTSPLSGTVQDNFDDGIIGSQYITTNQSQMAESSGYIQLYQNITDNGPTMSLYYDSGDSRYVSIRYRNYHHMDLGSYYGYYYGNFIIYNAGNTLLYTSLNLCTHDEFTPFYGTVIRTPNISAQYETLFTGRYAAWGSSYPIYTNNTTLSGQERFDQWFTAQVIIDKQESTIMVYIDNTCMGSATCQYHFDNKLIFYRDASAWWTGHYQFLDDLEIQSVNSLAELDL